MKVYLKPAAGSAQDNLDRAKSEMERVISFRGRVTGAKVEGKQIAITIAIDPKWDLPEAERVSNLKEWIRAKTRIVFRVQSIK
jgi:hypothetical protein